MAVTDFAELASLARQVQLRPSMIQEADTGASNTWDLAFANPKFLDNTTRSGRPEVIAGPTTSAAWTYSSNTERSIPHPVAATGDIRLGGCSIPARPQTSTNSQPVMVIDILCVQGGLATNTISSQTTNLPTATLPTRGGGAAGGAGVWAGITWTTASSSTDFDITVTYTNSAGTGSRTGTVETTTTHSDGYFRIVPMQAGDSGVRSVESIQLSAASGTGTLGIMLFKPLFILPPTPGRHDFTTIAGWHEPIDDEAVIAMLTNLDGLSAGSASTWLLSFFEA